NVAKKHGVSREDQDAYALESHRRAARAWEEGGFAKEVVSVDVPQKKGEPVVFARDESIRPDTSLAALAKLAPVFRKGGTVTAGNSSPINDGASALLLASADAVQAGGVRPLARIVGTATAGVDPNLMGEGPIVAIRKLLHRAALRVPNV